LKPETAFTVRRVIETFLNKICKTYNFSSNPDSYREIFQSYVREAFPGRDQEFYSDVYLDFLLNIVEPAMILDQNNQWGESPNKMEVKEEMNSNLKGVTIGFAETISQDGVQKGKVSNLPLIHLALNQIEALGDCLVAIGEAKEFELRKKTLVSLGILIRKVTGIIVDLLEHQGVKET
jgi:hypothetical protein